MHKEETSSNEGREAAALKFANHDPAKPDEKLLLVCAHHQHTVPKPPIFVLKLNFSKKNLCCNELVKNFYFRLLKLNFWTKMQHLCSPHK